MSSLFLSEFCTDVVRRIEVIVTLLHAKLARVYPTVWGDLQSSEKKNAAQQQSVAHTHLQPHDGRNREYEHHDIR